MATELKLPDMGEGIEDVTINRWVVKEGESVNEGDVIVEVATDKVDTEVPAPAGGTLLKTNFSEGELVPIDAVLGVIGAEGEEVGDSNGSAPAAPAEKEEAPQPQAETAAPKAEAPSSNGSEVKATPVAKRVAAEKGVALSGISGTGPNGQITKQDVLDYADGAAGGTGAQEALPGELADVPSLVVQRLAAENDLDLAEVAGDKPLSALTKYDVLSAIASRAAGETVVVEPRFSPPKPAPQQAAPASTVAPAAAQPAAQKPASAPAAAPAEAGPGEELVKPTRMRQIIAKNTFNSLQSSPQLTTWHDVDMTAVLQHRKANRKEFADQGVNLTVTAYLIAATVAGLRAIPAANARWTDDGILIKRNYNIGMAAAMPADQYGLGGLIVPVIHNAGDLNLLGIARQVNALADKARNNKLGNADLQGGTFTLTNYGTSGSVFQTPIIHEGQAGILGTGATEKRPVVVSNGHPLEPNMGDYMAFKPMMTLAFTFDHRILDGATADAFCVAVKNALENWS